MHARVSTYTGEPESMVDAFESVSKPLEEIDGFSHGYFLVDRGNNRAISITIWQSEDALLQSAAKADELRQGATSSAGGTIESVESYEVAVTVSGKKAAVG